VRGCRIPWGTHMDGTRDRLPDRTAENWRRGDRVRRIAATASWSNLPRHAAFAAAAPAAAADVIIGFVPNPAPSEPPLAQPLKVETEVPKQNRPPLTAPSPTGQKHSRKTLAVSLSLGAIAVAAMVALGAVFILRPDVEVQPTQVAAAAVVEAPEMAQPGSTAITVHLRVGAGLSTAERQRIQAALAKAGYSAVVVQQMPFSISRSRIGYFREADRTAAEGLIAALRGTQDVIELRDYSKLMSMPEPGRLDLWIRS
jgi:hypothetical protein